MLDWFLYLKIALENLLSSSNVIPFLNLDSFLRLALIVDVFTYIVYHCEELILLLMSL